MNRFLPDTLFEAFLRPFLMALPNGNVYIEIMAPDIRFGVMFALVACILARTSSRCAARNQLPLFAFLFLSFVGWLATSGNGRYFIPILLLIGPALGAASIVLVKNKSSCLTLMSVVLGLQIWTLVQVNPLGAWSQAKWRNPSAFDLEFNPELASEPAVYITTSSPTFSIIAPMFSPDSSWVNMFALQEKRSDMESLAITSALERNLPIRLVMPVGVRSSLDPVSRQEIIESADDLAEFGLSFSAQDTCQFLRSQSLVPSYRIEFTSNGKSVKAADPGILVCSLSRGATRPRANVQASASVESAVARIESDCPRFFKPGHSTRLSKSGMLVLLYPGSDMKLYVRSHKISYLYFRALNEVQLGTDTEILSGLRKIDCEQIAGRTGMPWSKALE